MGSWQTLLIGGAALLLLLGGCGQPRGSASGEDYRPRLAYVTNGIDPFWTIAQAGVEAGGREFGADVMVRMPANASDQQRIIQDEITRGVDGLAVSPIDAANQVDIINLACENTRVITHDSDAPGTNRLCYVGMDNYEAGRMCGELVKEAIPGGGEVMIFVGRLEQDNARGRRQGVIDEILGRSHDRERYDKPGEALEGGGYTILATLTDQFDDSKAKSNAEDTLARHGDLACMVGLFAYNPPMCLEALDRAGKLGSIKVVAFDEADRTLQGIKDGTVHGTVVQDPYRYGYESVRILAALTRGEPGALPEGAFLNVPARQIRKDNVDAFRSELKKRLERK